MVKSTRTTLSIFIFLAGAICSATIPAYAQQISGTVTDASTGDPLPGVNVYISELQTGTATDAEGNYAITNIEPGMYTLIASFIGYERYETTVDLTTGQSVTLDIQMQQGSLIGDEVVVVGYGTQRRRDVTYAVSSITGETVSPKGTISPMQGLQGQIAGADITANSGRAGSEYNIQIRGQNSLSGGNPLFVVDGVVVGDINFLNPQDIENIDVLKDAASTAVFGSRGSNGVVIVTTKQGSNRTTVTYDGYVGIRQNARMPDFMNGDEWWEFRQNAYITDRLQAGEPYDETIGGIEGSELLAERLASKDYTFWPDLFLQTGIQTNQWITVSGISNNNIQYVIGGGYQEERGNLKNEWYNRYNFKGNVNHKLNEAWSAGISVNLSVSERELGSEDGIKNAYRMSPLVAPYDSTGELLFQPAKYAGISFTSSINPLWELRDASRNRSRTFGIGNFYLEFSPLEWLSVRSSFAPLVEFEREGEYYGPHTEERQLQDPAATLEKQQSLSYSWDNKISVLQDFGDHSFDLMGLFSYYNDRAEESEIEVENLPYNSLYYNLGTARDIQDVGSGFSKTTLASYMLRMNYSYLNKYLVALTARWDGSSKLAEGYKWQSFPSASIGWRISEEDFFRINAISDLKLRVSYGFTGNNNIDPYSTQALSSAQTMYDFGGDVAKGFAPNGIVNRRLTWEKTREYDIGLDYQLFSGRVYGSVDYYNKLSDKLLLERELPNETGWGSLTDNIGSVKNNGVELYLQTTNILTRDFSWQTTLTFARNNNEIVELYNKQEDLVGNAWFIGEPINVNYTYVYDGVWKDQQAAQEYGQTRGEARVKDLNNDGTINGDDRTIIGTPYPDWTGGFSTRFNYKRFDLSVTLYARQGVQIFSPLHEEFQDVDDRGRAKFDVDYYMPANDVTPARDSDSAPQPHNKGPYWDEVGSYKDASFIKVQNILLGYNFSPELLQNVNIRSLRLYFNVLNPFVFTKYDGFDPEWAGSGLDDSGNSFITYQFGVNLQF